MQRVRFLFPAFILAALAVAAGCGGSGTATPFVSPAPHTGPTTIPVGPTPQVVTITGAGYALTFTLPAVTVGSAATVSAALQASPPAGIPAPQVRRRATIGGNPTTLVYITLSSTATVGFSSLPSFSWTLPSATTIPAGLPSYMAWWDPYVGQWQAHLGPGSQSGTTLTFPSTSGGITLNANAQYVYALVYTTQPVPTASPAPTPTASSAPAANTVPVTVVNNNTQIPSSSINFFIYGQDNTSGAWEYVTANGNVVPIPSAGNKVAPIPWTGSGNTSQTLYLPPLTSGRIYIYDGTPGTGAFTVGANNAGPNAPAPWAGTDGSKSTYFDFVEYSYNGSPLSFDVDTSQVDAFGLALRMDLYGLNGNPQSTGFLTGAVSKLSSMLSSSPTNTAAWTSLSSQMPYRVLNPGHISGTYTSFLDSVLQSEWNTYQNGVFMTMTGSELAATKYTANAYGTVDSNGNFNWYSAPNTSSTYLGSLPAFSNFPQYTITQQIIAAEGALVQVTPDPTYPKLMPKIGDYVGAALNRGVMNVTTQPDCTPLDFYQQPTYQNQFANYLHQIAANSQYGFNQAYAFSYDDACGFSTNISDPAPTKLIVTINPS